jgi:hypothetical protein
VSQTTAEEVVTTGGVTAAVVETEAAMSPEDIVVDILASWPS